MFALPLTNRFDRLPEVEPAGGVYQDMGGEQPISLGQNARRRRPRKPRAERPQPYLAETEHAGGVRVQPHGDSYFLPGKVAGKAVTFLLDSGCAINLLSRRVFDALPLKERRGIEPYTREHGTLADGSCFPFYGITELTGHVRDQVIQETFVISQLEEDARLGMPFLKRHGCYIDFSKSAMLMAGKELTCVNKSRRLLVGGVQVVRNCMIPGRSQATIHCRVNSSQISGLGWWKERTIESNSLAALIGRLHEERS